MKLRIATYNIHKGVSSLGSRPRVHALKNAIAALQADVVFLQEVQGRHDRHATRHAAHWPDEPQHDFLAGESHHVAYGMNAVYDHGHHGNALLSRLPILTTHNHDVSDHAWESRGILHCVLHAEPAAPDIHCFVIHLGLFAGSRKRQAAALVEAVTAAAPPEAPVIIAGDFNDWGDRLSADLRDALGVTEVFDGRFSASEKGRGIVARLRGALGRRKPARTFPAMLPWFRLDRIYVRGCAVRHAEVLFGPAWARLSDHAPIVAELEIGA